MYIEFYVYDIILAGRTEKQVQEIKQRNLTPGTWEDPKSTYFLKMKVIQEKERKTLWIGQPAYTENLLKRVWMQDSI